jgi:hypothetical protein
VAIITATVVLEAEGVPMVMAGAGAAVFPEELARTMTKMVKELEVQAVEPAPSIRDRKRLP